MAGNDANTKIVARRIRFVEHVPPGATARRSFEQPRPMHAIEEEIDWSKLTRNGKDSQETDAQNSFLVVFVPPGATGEWNKSGKNWLNNADSPFAKQATISLNGRKKQLALRPDRAVVHCSPKEANSILLGLIDFAFYLRETIAIEEAVAVDEAKAPGDATHAYRIGTNNREHWERMGETIERLAKLRLQFARLEPCLANASPTLPLAAQRLVDRLIDKANVEDRLVAVSDRLEACEDLYEGASDRIADYRLYRTGHWLEIFIIVLLLIEVGLMSAEVYLRWLDYITPVDETSAEEEPAPPHSKSSDSPSKTKHDSSTKHGSTKGQ